MKLAQLWLSSIVLVALTATAGAQTWDETANGGGDTGDLPGTAQVVSGNPSDSLIAITGSLEAISGTGRLLPRFRSIFRGKHLP